jgi:excinuclease ABC subunit B
MKNNINLKLVSEYSPKGDQQQAIDKLVGGLNKNEKHQTLLGITGSGKTYTLANVIEKTQLPTLIISPNKTLAAQLYEEFKNFFPENKVEYFISFYDYYQPEAYLPSVDKYIEKDAKINQEIEQMRASAVNSILTGRDVIVIASVSAIYDLGNPKIFENMKHVFRKNDPIQRRDISKKLVFLQYKKNNLELKPGTFRFRENVLEIFVSTGHNLLEIDIQNNKINKINLKKNYLKNNKDVSDLDTYDLFPAKLFVTEKDKLNLAIIEIEKELKERLSFFKKNKQILEYERLKRITNYDLALLKEMGYCPGVENYSLHLSFRKKGDTPYSLLDHFIYSFKDYLIVLDESHIGIPQLKGMYMGNKKRKETLVEHGFRLPSAIENRPLKFNEFEKKVDKIIYTSATPSEYEVEKSKTNLVEQIIRPTGVLDPEIEVRPCKTQVEDIIKELEKQVEKKEKTLILTLTKRSSENLTRYLKQRDFKVEYIHSEIKPLERPKILEKLRNGKIDAVIGINLLREGLDIPEVSVVAILDADKEGFLRNKTSMLQAIGRAARNKNGKAILYADKVTKSIQETIDETDRRREIQKVYNKKHNITSETIKKKITQTETKIEKIPKDEKIISYLQKELNKAIKE